jgi:FdhD protein
MPVPIECFMAMGMKRSGEGADAVREVPARRLSTAVDTGGGVDETVRVVVEEAVSIDVQGVETYTLLCTPGENRALAAGFLLSEGIVDDLDEVAGLEVCRDDASVIRVRLKRKVPRIDDAGRNLLIVSSCGLCGAEGLDEKVRALPRVGESLRIGRRILNIVREELSSHQPLFHACGGTHAAGIFTSHGEIVAAAEDAGRHNALDKAIGRCLLSGTRPAGHGAALSGRVSLEMVGKCSRAGIELIAAISAPTSLAVEVARRCGITMCAFVREDRATVFTHPGRIE